MNITIPCGHPLGSMCWNGVGGERTYCEVCSEVRLVRNRVASKVDGARGKIIDAHSPMMHIEWEDVDLGSFTVFQSCLELIQ